MKEIEGKFEAVKRFFEKVFEEPEAFPDKALLLPLTKKEIRTLFTKERIRLIMAVKGRKARSVSEFASLLNRKLPAVTRDLKLLERFGIVELIKKGKTVTPVVKPEILLLPLVELKPISITKQKLAEMTVAQTH